MKAVMPSHVKDKEIKTYPFKGKEAGMILPDTSDAVINIPIMLNENRVKRVIRCQSSHSELL